MTLAAMFYRGYAFGISDQAFYLSYLYRWTDPSLYPNDYLFSFLDYRDNLVWPLLGILGRWIKYEVLFAALYVASSFLSLLLVYRVAFSLWGRRSSALLAACLWTPTYMVPVAIIPTSDLFFTVRTLGMLLGLWLIDRTLNTSPARAGAVVFLGGLIHLISVLPIALGLGLAQLARRNWRMLSALASGLLLSAVLLALYWRSHGVAHPLLMAYSGQWYELAKTVMPDLFAEAWNWPMWGRVVALPICTLALLGLAARSGGDPIRARSLEWASGGIVCYALAGWVGTGVFHSYVAMQLCPFRGYYYLLLFASIAIAGQAAKLMETHCWPDALLGGWVLGAWITDNTPLQVLATMLLLARPCMPRLRERSRVLGAWLNGRRTRLLGLLLAILLFLLADEILAHFAGAGIWNLVNNALPPGLRLTFLKANAFALICLGLGALFRKPVPIRMTLIALVALGEVTFFSPPYSVLDHLAQRASTRAVLGTRAFRLVYPPWTLTYRQAKGLSEHYDKVDAGKRLALRSRQLLPIGVTVIVPPSWEFFRERSLRSSFVTFKDRGPAKDSKKFADFWLGRMLEVKAWRGVFAEDYVDTLPLKADEVIALAWKYRGIRLDYIATPNTYPFPLLAEERPYYLYRIPLDSQEIIPPGGAPEP